MRNLFLLSFCLIFANCSYSKSEVIHPTEEFLSKITNADQTVSLNDEPDPLFTINEAADLIKVIGDSDDIHSEYFLPEVGDVTVGAELIFITIPQLNEIRAYDYKGNFKFKFGRTGMGPGEFQRLQSIDFDEKSQNLVAVDAGEVKIFEIKKDSAIVVNTIKIPTASWMSDACILNDAIFVNGITVEVLDSVESGAGKYARLKGSLPIHKYDLESGEELFDFGESYLSASGFVGFDAIFSETKLHCSESSNTVVGMFKHFPLIVGYNPETGKQKWSTGIEDFISPQREENLRGNATLNRVRKYYDNIESMAEIKAGFLLLQTNPRPQNAVDFILSDFERADIKSFKRKVLLLNTSTGEIDLLDNIQDRILFQNNRITISEPLLLENPAERIHISQKKYEFQKAAS